MIVGDFNQRTPRVKYGNKIAAEEIEKAFKDYEIITKGIIGNLSRAGIDHIAIDNQLKAKQVWGWPNLINDKRLSGFLNIISNLEKEMMMKQLCLN